MRGGPVVRAASLVTGLSLFALGIVLILESELGLPPWDVLNQGLTERTPLSFGTANIAVACVVLALAWRLGARVGPGTIANAILIGLTIDLLLAVDAVTALSDESLAVRVALLLVGLGVIALGSGLYIGAALGAGPRDSLMLALAARRRVRIGLVRALLESSVTLVGLALGGTVGVGTVLFAFGIGGLIELAFGALVLARVARPAAVAPSPVGSAA
jgi:uncharacterized membrane protein YczE